MTQEEIFQIVGAITYKPGWEIFVGSDIGRKGGRCYVQLEATTLDSTGEHKPTTWRSAKRYLSPFMCRQEIVGAVFGLIKDAEEHEMREWFRYRGASIFNPHLDPDVLVEVAKKKSSFNVRENAMSMKESV